MRRTIFGLVAASVCLLFLVTCSNNLGVVVRSTPSVNNGGNPVVVRVYQLKSAGSFQRATVESFWGKERATLGADLLGDPVELVLHPGETRKIKGIEINDGTLFIGAAADFYQPDVTEWKSIIDVSEMKDIELVLAVGNNRLLLGSLK